MTWSFNIIILCRAIELKSSELVLTQNQLISQPSYRKCSYSAHFFLSRSRVEPKYESISSSSRASSFSCSPSCTGSLSQSFFYFLSLNGNFEKINREEISQGKTYFLDLGEIFSFLWNRFEDFWKMKIWTSLNKIQTCLNLENHLDGI